MKPPRARSRKLAFHCLGHAEKTRSTGSLPGDAGAEFIKAICNASAGVTARVSFEGGEQGGNLRFLAPERSVWGVRGHFGLGGCRWNSSSGQSPPAHQIVSRGRKGEDPPNAPQATVFGLLLAADSFHPTENFFDNLASC